MYFNITIPKIPHNAIESVFDRKIFAVHFTFLYRVFSIQKIEAKFLFDKDVHQVVLLNILSNFLINLICQFKR